MYFKTPDELSEFVKGIKPENVLQYPQYISMTAGGIYNPAAQVIFYILGASMGADIQKYNPEEMEVLYGRDFPFEVLEVEVINGVYHVLSRELTK